MLEVAQYTSVMVTWAGYLVPEGLLLVAAHHLTGHYNAVNTYFIQILDRLIGDREKFVVSFLSSLMIVSICLALEEGKVKYSYGSKVK